MPPVKVAPMLTIALLQPFSRAFCSKSNPLSVTYDTHYGLLPNLFGYSPTVAYSIWTGLIAPIYFILMLFYLIVLSSFSQASSKECRFLILSDELSRR